MPYKTGKMKGLLTLSELKKLVVNHNKLSKISMPSNVKRDALIKLINTNGYRVDHTNNKLVKGGGLLKKPVQPAKKKVMFTKGKTKEIKETKKELKSRADNIETIEANKKENKRIRDLLSQTKQAWDEDDLNYVKRYNMLKNQKTLLKKDIVKTAGLRKIIIEDYVDIEDGVIKDEMLSYAPLREVLKGLTELRKKAEKRQADMKKKRDAKKKS